MSLPGNGIFVVRGEMSTLLTAMRRGSRWNSTAVLDDEKEPLLKLFIDLKNVLNRVEDLRLIDPSEFVTPFLEVIRTDETTGVVTSLALAAINKFLLYGLIDPMSPNLAVTVENIVDAVTHARFMGTDQSSDGVTLFRVVQVLHTLMRSPEGNALSNEAVCEIMLSCFKICFEPRLNELLRRSAEQALKDMVLLLFMRLPQFSEENSDASLLKKFQLMAASIDQDKKSRKKLAKNQISSTHKNCQREVNVKRAQEDEDAKIIAGTSGSTVTTTDDNLSPNMTLSAGAQIKNPPLATTPATPAGNILDMQGKISQTPTTSQLATTTTNIGGPTAIAVPGRSEQKQVIASAKNPELSEVHNIEEEVSGVAAEVVEESRPTSATSAMGDGSSEYINSVGVRFTHHSNGITEGSNEMTSLLPYGLPCVQELFRFLILLCNPLDKQNTDTMMHMGLSLLTVAFEVGADNIGKFEMLLELVKDDLCRNLIALLSSERLTIFAADLQLCFLLFESLRGHLKFQLEAYIKKLSEIIANDNPKTPYEIRELSLDNLLQLFRIPGFVAELYINYDCDLYSSDILENTTKLLSKFTLSATSAVYGTHILAIDAIISIIDGIEQHCLAAKSVAGKEASLALTSASNSRHSRHSSGLEGIIIDSGNNNTENKCAVENISKYLQSTSVRSRLCHSTDFGSVSREQLAEIKRKKCILAQGTELFNQRPEKGIQYLQENGILKETLDPMEVALFLRENPGLDKKMVGEYISKKKNVDSKILKNFVESFDFSGLRVDQALRLYLETFRLSGEAQLIFLVLEHFADHWHKQNGEPFADTDAPFQLAYAIIMLNVDQHNCNARRLNVPMTAEDFVRNLRGLNGGGDFDQEMLLAIFNAIKNEEIIMPAEQTGLVRENYLWKVLLRRGRTRDGIFNYVDDFSYDLEIFQIIWGASLSALSFMFDKSNENGYQRTLTGFRKSAAVSAHYNLYSDFDALILTLCKFTTLLNTIQVDGASVPPHSEIGQAVNFGLNPKAQAALKTVFGLVHEYGDSLREGWKSILDVHLQLFRLKLLPKSLMEVEDFCEPNGKVMLIVEKPVQKQEAGLFSSLYSYLSSEGQREPSYEEQEFIKIGRKCIKECQLDQIIQESKFIQLESLKELLKTILEAIKAPTAHKSVGLPYAEDVVVFWMEFLVKIVIHNRDRMTAPWPNIRDHMYLLVMGSAACGYDYLLNRSIVAVLKLAIYLMRNEELCPMVLQSLKMLLKLKSSILLRISKQISTGIYELLKTSAQNIHTEEDWQIIFTILECVGAGAIPPDFDDSTIPILKCTKSDGALSGEENSALSDRGYTSDSELTDKQQQVMFRTVSNTSSPFIPSTPTTENWILVNRDTDLTVHSRPQSPPSGLGQTNSLLAYNCQLIEHSPYALFKCWDSLVFIVRNVAHITPYNFESCVRCIRTFVEACRDGGLRQRRKFEAATKAPSQKRRPHIKRSNREPQSKSVDTLGSVQADPEIEDLAQRYETLSIQLLDLMYTLYTRTAQIFRWWAEEDSSMPHCSSLWAQGWCPLLQGIARLAMDRRREVRTYAISCLQQRALLVHDLQSLSGSEWASCFRQVLFPLLNELLPESPSIAYLDIVLLEESRIRTATIMSKVFLHHLTPLIELGPLFNELWIDILDYIDKFMKVGSDMLSEQMQEILKNMLLVMHSVRIFHNSEGTLHSPLWELTWNRIGEFLPNLKNELFCIEEKQKHIISEGIENKMIALSEANISPLQQQQQQYHHQQQQHTNLTEVNVVRTPIPSPMESSRQSIILQPPKIGALQGKSFALGQFSLSQPAPLLIPLDSRQSHSQSCESIMSSLPKELSCSQTANLIQSKTELAVPERSISSEVAMTTAVFKSPDLLNDASKYDTNIAMIAMENETSIADSIAGKVNACTSSRDNEYSMEISINGACDPLLNAAKQANVDSEQDPKSQPHQNQQQQQQHIHLQQQQEEQQHQYQQQQQKPQNEDMLTHSTSPTSVLSPPMEDSATDATSAIQPVVPISHLIAGNQYPSLSNKPHPAIVHSFTPIYIPQSSKTQPRQNETDIFHEYVQNPYNLTLQEQLGHQQQQQQQQQKQLQQQQHKPQEDLVRPQELSSQQLNVSEQASILMQSPANYFATNIDPNTIPPGSELLYGQF